MENPDLIVGRPGGQTTRDGRQPNTAWVIVRGAGLLFLMAGLSDILLAVFPASFSDPNQRFGTLVGVVSGWPILALGTVGFHLGALALSSITAARVGVGLHAVGAVALAAILLMLIFDRGGVAAAAGPAAVSINRGFLRAVVGALVFLVVHIMCLRQGTRVLR